MRYHIINSNFTILQKSSNMVNVWGIFSTFTIWLMVAIRKKSQMFIYNRILHKSNSLTSIPMRMVYRRACTRRKNTKNNKKVFLSPWPWIHAVGLSSIGNSTWSYSLKVAIVSTFHYFTSFYEINTMIASVQF